MSRERTSQVRFLAPFHQPLFPTSWIARRRFENSDLPANRHSPALYCRVVGQHTPYLRASRVCLALLLAHPLLVRFVRLQRMVKAGGTQDSKGVASGHRAASSTGATARLRYRHQLHERRCSRPVAGVSMRCPLQGQFAFKKSGEVDRYLYLLKK